MPQTTLISFFKYTGFRNRWNALGRMGRPPIVQKEVAGLSFFKPLGTGSGNGFSIKPDFSTYGFVAVFNTEELARAFLKTPVIQVYTKTATAHSHVLMHTTKSHGQWSKQEPFKSSVKFELSKPIAVITRATIRPKLAYKFWRNVPSVSKSMEGYDALLFRRALVSFPANAGNIFAVINAKAMMNYAYQNPKHAEMVKKPVNWGGIQKIICAFSTLLSRR